MSATVRLLLQASDTTRVTVFDRWQPQELVSERLAEFGDRVRFLQVDVADAASLPDVDATHVVHGATVVWSPELEAANARSYVDVNVGGTVNMLEWALARDITRFVHVSSGDSYGRQTRWSPIEIAGRGRPVRPARAVRDLEVRLGADRAPLRRALPARRPRRAARGHLRPDGAPDPVAALHVALLPGGAGEHRAAAAAHHRAGRSTPAATTSATTTSAARSWR